MVMMPCNTFQFTLYLCLIHVLYTGLRFLLIQFITDLIRGHLKTVMLIAQEPWNSCN